MSGDLTARDVIARVLKRYPFVADVDMPDHVLAALAAAGWELHRAGEVVPTDDVLNLAQQWEDGWGIDTSAHWRDSEDCAAELRALTQQELR